MLMQVYRWSASTHRIVPPSPYGNEDDGCQFVEAAVMGRALSTRSCTGQTHVGAASPRSTNQPHDDAMGGKVFSEYGKGLPGMSWGVLIDTARNLTEVPLVFRRAKPQVARTRVGFRPL